MLRYGWMELCASIDTAARNSMEASILPRKLEVDGSFHGSQGGSYACMEVDGV